jgi:hypothetical protein
MRILHIIKESIFGTHQKINNAIFVPVHKGWAGCMTGQDSTIDHPLIAEKMPVSVCRDVSKETYVSTIHQEVQSAVKVPVCETKLASSAFACNAIVHSQQTPGFVLGTVYRIEYRGMSTGK